MGCHRPLYLKDKVEEEKEPGVRNLVTNWKRVYVLLNFHTFAIHSFPVSQHKLIIDVAQRSKQVYDMNLILHPPN